MHHLQRIFLKLFFFTNYMCDYYQTLEDRKKNPIPKKEKIVRKKSEWLDGKEVIVVILIELMKHN